MEKVIILGYEFVTVLLAEILTTMIFCRIYRKKSIKISGRHILCTAFFAVYIFGVFHFTGAGTIFDAGFYGIEFRSDQLNLIPFSDKSIDFMAYGLNVLLFIPLGFLLPFIWLDSASVKYIGFFGAALSLLVEASQLLNNRRTDVDDLILNTVGALLGFILYKIFCCDLKCASLYSVSYKNEAAIYMLMMFLGRFLLFNEF